MKAIKISVLTLSAVIGLYALLGGLGVRASSGDDNAYRQLGVYSEVLSHVRSWYVEEPNIPKVTNGALHGLLESLDANSGYLDPQEYKVFKEQKDGKAGIGATVSKRFGYGVIIAVLPGGPADKAGVNGTDIIEAINDKSTREMSVAEIQYLLSGAPGTNVTLSIVRARRAEPEKITITRSMVSVPPVTDKMLESGIGYIQVESLPKGRSAEIAARIRSLQKNGAKRLLLDLRNAADGDEQEGVAVANLFLGKGTIAYLQGQKYPRENFVADPQKQITTLPLTVLVNHGTAGPAELVAAAILDNQRGDLVGDKTFGLGSIQKIIEVQDGSALILSVAKYYSPSGKSIQDAAVTPNILVASNDDDSAAGDEDESVNAPAANAPKSTDEQLKRAVETLKNRS